MAMIDAMVDKTPSEAICVKTEIQPLCSPEHLHELRQFTSVVTLTLRVFR